MWIISSVKARSNISTFDSRMVSLSIILFTLLSLSSRFVISAEKVITCDGEIQRLSCDTGVISVQSVSFGRTNENICSIGQPKDQISNTQCSLEISVIAKRCDGLKVCEINTQGLSVEDPCVGTYKYYTTNYICIPAETSVTCQGGYSSLYCENGRIQINTANYGRTDKHTCSEGLPSDQIQNTSCYSPNALSPVSQRCNGMRSCEVFATHTVFTDPCEGTYKYLAISYNCLPQAVRSKVICEYRNSTLKCEEGTRLQIHNANYGRTESSICPLTNPKVPQQTDCYTSNSKEIVAERCDGKNDCFISASNAVFTDPCYGTLKYLQITYSCVAD